MENTDLYRESYLNIKEEPYFDDYGKSVVKLINLLDEANKETLLLIIKKVTIDSISTLFNLIDEGGDIEDISLIYNNEVINIDLQDYFLAYIEDETS